MYPSWGNYGAPQPQNYGGSGPHKPPIGGHAGPAPGFGGFEASPSGSMFSSLQEQHLQQMQQLKMLHQKQLQTVLQHGNAGGAYGGGHQSGYSGSPWQSEESGHLEPVSQPTRGPSAPQQDHPQPPPLPPQPHAKEPQPGPPPPEPPHSKPLESTAAPKLKDLSMREEEKASHLQEQQQLWYKQHLQNLQKLKQERAKLSQKDGEGPFPPPMGQLVLPPPPLDAPKNTPPPPPPKEEPPAPPPPPDETKIPLDPEEAARLQQLQAAAAQWQQVQQQRASLHYQALMQQHEKLQQILEHYQKLVQQPVNLQSMSAEMQLRHYENQKQQFTPLFQDWERTFILWFEQFQTYPHKDQLQDYEHQWKQWQEQMNATNSHLQERIATLTAMVPFTSSQYNSGIMGQFGHYPGQDMQMQQQPLNQAMQNSPVSVGARSQGPPPTPPAGPPVRGGGAAGIGIRPPGPTTVQQPSFSVRGPRGNNPRFDQPQQRFDGPPRFDQPQQRFDGPPRFDQPRHRFDGPPKFDQPRQHFDGSPRFDPPRMNQTQFEQRPRFEQPPRHPGPQTRFERPPAPQQKQQQGPQPQSDPVTKQPANMDSRTLTKSAPQPQSEKEKSKSESDKKTNSEDMSDDNILGNEGFFVQNDPIPQTLKTVPKPEESNGKNASESSTKPKPAISTPSVTAPSLLASKDTNSQNYLKPDGSLTNTSNPTVVPKPPETQQEPQASGQTQARPDFPRPPPGRGRGQPPEPAQVPGRGRGQRGRGEFRGSNVVSPGEEMGEMSYDYMPPEEDQMMPEGQEEYYWQDTSYGQLGGEESEIPIEEMWMPEEHYFPTEEEYYEAQAAGLPMGRGGLPMMRGGHPMGRGGPPMGRGGPPVGRGGPPMGRGGPPMGRGGPHMGRGGPPMGRGGPPMGRGGPPMGRGGPPMGRGRHPMGRGGPPMGRGGPPMGRGGPPMGRGGPPMGRGGPPMGRGGPPMGRGGPPMGRGGPPMGRGGPIDGHWQELESAEYSEEGDTYWGDSRPPMRGMRPPFPPGRGRPPLGSSSFMQQGRGLPHHPVHGPMDHESLGHGMNTGDATMDPDEQPMYHEHEPHNYPMHSEAGGGRPRVPPPPHEMMDPMGDTLYHEELEKELGWEPPHGRGPPMPPHEILERGGMRRRPMGRGLARGLGRPGSTNEEYKQECNEGYVEDYCHGEDGYRWRPPREYPPENYRHEAKFHESEWNRESLPGRDYPPHISPSEPYRDGHWREESERRQPYPYDEHDRGRELRIREYRDASPYSQEEQTRPPLPSEWDRSSRLPPPTDRGYPPEYEDRRPRYDDRREEAPGDIQPPPVEPVTNLPESSAEPSGANVLALSQRQHEIILKAAQELKLIRELKEGKSPGTEPQPSGADVLSDLPAGLLGLEIPPDVRNVLKGMTSAAHIAPTETMSWDSKPAATDYQPPRPAVIPKTVDYGHGHEPGATVERISYGERIVLRPDPVPSDRGYEKEPLGPRDPYSRDLYYERRSDPYMDRRDYSRERDFFREKPPPEYERERYERERYPPRDRDDSIQSMVEERSPLAPPPRPGYREREREIRERDRSGSRDREDHYGRPSYDRHLYERTGLDRGGPERYSHGSSPYMDRRSYPEERGPPTAQPLPPPPQPAPPVEKKPEIKNIDDILKLPGRLSRPERIVIIMRGLPGSGKSHVAKLIRDKEVDSGGAPPRVLGLDDYFMTEVEKVLKDPDTGRRVKSKGLEYEYEPEMEDTYRSSMLKTFKKTLDDGFFPFIILDTINDRVKQFDQFWSAAKTKGFEVYIAEINADTQTCTKRNVHGRTLKDIMKMSNNWESSPRHMVRLDVRSLLQDAAIEEVEMEDFNPDDEAKEAKREEEEEGDLGYIPKSKWEMDTSEAKLDKLDGLKSSGKRKRDGDHMSGLEDYLQLPDDYATRKSQPGKKRVRWADLEEQKEADRKRAIGFVVGQTDWERITDESGQLAQRALNRTKYF